MRVVLRQLSRLVGASLVLYLVALGLSCLVTPAAAADAPIDTYRAASTLYGTEPKYVFMARSRLASARDRLLLLGASNVMVGFRQAELARLLPDVEVDNLSVGGSNISQLAQIVQLVHEVQPAAARRRDLWVIGLWYGAFAPDRARWFTSDRVGGDTDIDIERYRYGFYRRSPRGPVALLPAHYLGAEVLAVQPYLTLDYLARRFTSWGRGSHAHSTDAARNAASVSAPERRRLLAFWHDYMGGIEQLPDAQFRALDGMLEQIQRQGGRALLVNMAIPAWHQAGSVLARDYTRKLELWLPRFLRFPAVSVLDMSDANQDDDFSDEVHPKPRVAPAWAARLARGLERLREPAAQAAEPLVSASYQTRTEHDQ